MPVTYKDIDDLVQRQQATGAEKVPVSATEYITAQQVADLAQSMRPSGSASSPA